MLKKYFGALLVLVLTMVLFAEQSQAQNEPGLKVTVSKKSLKPGDSGTLIIKFKTGPKVKIPKEPQIEVTLTNDIIKGTGMQDYSGGEGDYLSNAQVKYNFTVPSGTSSGDYTVTGKVKFPYCSTETGVCKIGTKSFSVNIKVK